MFQEVHTGWQVSVGHLLHDSLVFSVFIYFYYKKKDFLALPCPLLGILKQADMHQALI